MITRPDSWQTLGDISSSMRRYGAIFKSDSDSEQMFDPEKIYRDTMRQRKKV